MVVDFTDDDLEGGLARIAQTTADIHVGILINNVGVSYPYARFFHEVDGELTKNLLRVNIEVTTRMIQLFLPSMLKHKCGAIINVGSGAATVLPSDPLYSLYAATKAYVHPTLIVICSINMAALTSTGNCDLGTRPLNVYLSVENN